MVGLWSSRRSQSRTPPFASAGGRSGAASRCACARVSSSRCWGQRLGQVDAVEGVLGALRCSGRPSACSARPPGAANAQIGYLPQRRSFAPHTRLRGSDIVRLGLDGDRWGLPLPRSLAWGRARARARETRLSVTEAIELVGAGAYADRPIGELSGGEQQRLLIAQALVRRPQLLLLDEPLDSLDLANQGSSPRCRRICRKRGRRGAARRARRQPAARLTWTGSSTWPAAMRSRVPSRRSSRPRR